MACRRSADVLRSVNCADLVTPDGMPVVWLGRLLGHRNVRRVYGPDLMRKVCEISALKGFRNYFYGSTQDTLNRLKARLSEAYPGLVVSGLHAPPFRKASEEEDRSMMEEINNSNPDIVWVGLGSPKQDLWMHEHRERLNAPVMIGVGAAFDFLAGTKPQAPAWMRKSGLEWLFRLIHEPKRLWRRYLVDNLLFIYYIGLQLAGGKRN
jgi:N-acetylglucosaminyldiphosphoundecaprenol N-acetyl-beta-D-mannosaminyltransferase